MSMDDIARAEDKRLNNLVAITVVILTVFGAITKVKDDNINQAMQKAKADSVDAWAEYQFARVKLHVDENGLHQLRLLESTGQVNKELAAKQAAEYEADIKKYEGRSKETRAKAERLEAEYERLNFRDDQFDMSDVFLSIGGRGLGGRRAGRQFRAALLRLGERRARDVPRDRRVRRAGLPAGVAGAIAGDVSDPACAVTMSRLAGHALASLDTLSYVII